MLETLTLIRADVQLIQLPLKLMQLAKSAYRKGSLIAATAALFIW